MKNRVFFPQVALDGWVADDRVELDGDELAFKNEDRRYRIIEAIRVLAEVTGVPDPNELVGRVKTRAYLAELGAEILESSMVLGDNAYDVVPGFVGAPIGGFPAPRPATPAGEARRATTDEELLAAFIEGRIGGS
jgi:hypothetical protein